MQAKEKKKKTQGFLLKVHLFFNMKTLTGLSRIPHAVVSEVLWSLPERHPGRTAGSYGDV